MIDTTELLRQLSEAAGVSGYEEAVRALVHDALAPLADSLRTDALGNLIALQRGERNEPRPSIMLAAHMDEIGLMVSGYAGSFLRFHTVGGVDLRTLPGQEVTVHGTQPAGGHCGQPPAPRAIGRGAQQARAAGQALY